MAKRTQKWIKMNGAIRAICAEYAIDEDQRRSIIKQVTGVTSLGLCNDRQIYLVLNQFKTLTGSAGGNKSSYKPAGRVRNNRTDDNALKGPQDKITALWISLYDLGVVEDRTDRALNAFLKRRTNGPDALRFYRHEDADKAIRILKTMAKDRGGVDWSLDKHNPVRCVIEAQLKILQKLGELKCPSYDVSYYSEGNWRVLQKNWGAWIRRVQGACKSKSDTKSDKGDA